MPEMPIEDVNNLDAIVHELGIEDSVTTPAEVVRKLKAENERLRNALERLSSSQAFGLSCYIPDTQIGDELKQRMQFARDVLSD